MAMKMIGPINSGNSAGGAGTSTANADSPHVVSGFITAVYVKYNGSPPAGTTDVIIKTKGAGANAPSQTILSKSNSATDGWFYPSVQAMDTTGAAITGVYQDVPVFDYINVKIDQSNDNTSIDVWLLIRDP